MIVEKMRSCFLSHCNLSVLILCTFLLSEKIDTYLLTVCKNWSKGSHGLILLLGPSCPKLGSFIFRPQTKPQDQGIFQNFAILLDSS